MRHPLADKKIWFYSGLWIIIMIFHATVLFYYYQLPVKVGIADSFVFNFLTACFCLSYWYVVKYISPAIQGIASTIFIHIVGVSLFVAIISFVTSGLLDYLIPAKDYQTFLSHTFLFRIFLGMLYFTVTIMLYYLLIYIEQLKRKELKENQLQNLLKQSELDMLKFQINPHFLFNSLNSISALTLTAPAQAREMVLKLADFFRASLAENKVEVHTLMEELDQMTLYLDIEKVRFGERLVTHKEIDQECLNLTLPKMILQPLYENAIKFGMYEQLGLLTITTKGFCQDGNLNIMISNNFEGESSKTKGGGIGLSNVVNRLELIYGLSNLLTIKKKNNIFSVSMTIPQRAL